MPGLSCFAEPAGETSAERAAERGGARRRGQPTGSKRLAATFLRTFSGSQMRPFMAM